MEASFAAEKMLGRLAKWLRILGFDTLYEADFPEGFLGHLDGQRIVLTRRAASPRRQGGNPTIFIRSDDYREQLVEVVQAAGLAAKSLRPFSRCIRCNLPIIVADKANLREKVPDYVWQTHAVFKICPGCRRLYWAGSHIERGMESIRRLFNGPAQTT